jgi:hypothetical protein
MIKKLPIPARPTKELYRYLRKNKKGKHIDVKMPYQAAHIRYFFIAGFVPLQDCTQDMIEVSALETKIFKHRRSKHYSKWDLYGLFGFGEANSIDGTHQR